MAINLKGEEKVRDIIPEGNYLARLYSVIELGTVPVAYKEDPVRQIRLTWELSEELRDFDGVEKPLVIGNSYTASMFKLAKLRGIVEGMVGKLADDEADEFDLHSILEKPCMLNVVHTVGKNGRTYANVASCAPLPKAIKEVPKQYNTSVWLDYSEDGWDGEVYKSLPAWVQREMGESAEMKRKINGDDYDPFAKTDENFETPF